MRGDLARGVAQVHDLRVPEASEAQAEVERRPRRARDPLPSTRPIGRARTQGRDRRAACPAHPVHEHRNVRRLDERAHRVLGCGPVHVATGESTGRVVLDELRDARPRRGRAARRRRSQRRGRSTGPGPNASSGMSTNVGPGAACAPRGTAASTSATIDRPTSPSPPSSSSARRSGRGRALRGSPHPNGVAAPARRARPSVNRSSAPRHRAHAVGHARPAVSAAQRVPRHFAQPFGRERRGLLVPDVDSRRPACTAPS